MDEETAGQLREARDRADVADVFGVALPDLGGVFRPQRVELLTE
jgi:hypothetical protein